MKETEVVTGTVSLFDYRFLWEKFKSALDERDKAHADYRALEEHRASVEFLLKIEREAHEATLQELASIKARVGELVAADHEYDICSLEFREAYNEGCDETEALADDLTRAASRRRLALESFT